MNHDYQGSLEAPAELESAFDVIVVGAGFAGLYALHQLRKMGLSVKAIEAGLDVGGTWYWNRYPGARCDAQSLAYSFTFSKELVCEWNWSENYAAQDEILQYLRFVAERLDLYRDIQLGTRVTAAHYVSGLGRWRVLTDQGHRFRCKYLVFASGPLSAGIVPEFSGLDSYAGKTFHTGSWPHEKVEFANQRVAVIGTGSSGVQVIPSLAKEASELYVFQRTANFVLPARNAPLQSDDASCFRDNLDKFRGALQQGELVGIGDVLLDRGVPPSPPQGAALEPDERHSILEARWNVGGVNIWKAFGDVRNNIAANEIVAEFIRVKIKSIVKNPEVAEKLTPRGYLFGSKRPCVGTDYYETFNRSNVTLIDIKNEPIVCFREDGIETSDQVYPVDSVIFATGYDAVTGALLRVDIRGESVLTLKEAWATGAKSYLGLAVAGFPNMFTILGPGSPSVLGNCVVNIEQHVEWMCDLIKYAQQNAVARIEVDPAAQLEWVGRVAESAKETVLAKGKSWYVGANVPGKTQEFLAWGGGMRSYRKYCEDVALNGYRGFRLRVE